MFFEQISIGGYDNNLIYLLGADASDVCVVDPVEIDKLLEINDKISAILITHTHFDHIAGTPALFSALGPMKVYVHKSGLNQLDDIPAKYLVGLEDGQMIAEAGLEIKVHHTPGHRFDSVCYEVEDKLITGDTLFVGLCGRCDLPGSDVNDMYDSLYNKIAKLDRGLEVYPGHDYGPKKSSTLKEEFLTNKYLQQASSEDEFVNLRMN